MNRLYEGLSRFRVAPAEAMIAAGLVVCGLCLSADFSSGVVAFVLAAGMCLALLSPEAALFSVGLSTPFIFHPVAVGSNSFSLLELALLVTAFSVLVHLVWDWTREPGMGLFRAMLEPWSVTAIALMLLIAGMISLITVAEPAYRAESFRAFRWTIVEPLLMLAAIRYLCLRGRPGWIFAGLLGAGLVVSVGSLADLVQGGGMPDAGLIRRSNWPYPHANNLALFLVRIVPVAFALAMSGSRDRAVRWALLVLTVIGLAATRSRGAEIAMIAGVMTVYLILLRSAKRQPMSRATVVVVGLLAVTVAMAFIRFFRDSADSVANRELIWRSSKRMIEDHPVWGVGLDQYLYQYGRRYVLPEGWPERYTSHPHNVILDFWLSLGIPGLIALTLMIAVAVRAAFHLARENSDDWLDVLKAGSIGALAAGLVHGLVDNSYFIADLAMLTWIFIGVATFPKHLTGILAGRTSDWLNGERWRIPDSKT